MQLLTRGDDKARFELFDHGDGFFSFEESCEAVDNVSELGSMPHYSCSHISGLYDSLAAAERDALATIPWMRSGERE